MKECRLKASFLLFVSICRCGSAALHSTGLESRPAMSSAQLPCRIAGNGRYEPIQQYGQQSRYDDYIAVEDSSNAFCDDVLLSLAADRWLRRPIAAVVHISILGTASASGSFVPRHAAIGGYLLGRGSSSGVRHWPLFKCTHQSKTTRDGRRPPHATESRIRYDIHCLEKKERKDKLNKRRRRKIF